MHESSCARVGAVPSSSSSRRHRRSRCAAPGLPRCPSSGAPPGRSGATSAASTSTSAVASSWRCGASRRRWPTRAERCVVVAHHRGRRARRRIVDVGSAADSSGRGLRSSQHRLDPARRRRNDPLAGDSRARPARRAVWVDGSAVAHRPVGASAPAQRPLRRAAMARLVLIGRPAGRDPRRRMCHRRGVGNAGPDARAGRREHDRRIVGEQSHRPRRDDVDCVLGRRQRAPGAVRPIAAGRTCRRRRARYARVVDRPMSATAPRRPRRLPGPRRRSGDHHGAAEADALLDVAVGVGGLGEWEGAVDDRAPAHRAPGARSPGRSRRTSAAVGVTAPWRRTPW